LRWSVDDGKLVRRASLAGHASLADTQRYIEPRPEAKRRVLAMYVEP